MKNVQELWMPNMRSMIRRGSLSELRSFGHVLTALAIVAVAMIVAAPAAHATLGVCDTASNVEVEATAGTVGPSGYATLNLAAVAINAGTHQGIINIEVCGTTAETLTSTFNASGAGAASYTSITIKPVGGAARTISGGIVSGPLVDFNGADNVTIDGLNSGGNSLTIANTNTGSTANTSTIRLIGGASNNTIRRSNIQGSGTSALATIAGTILFSTDTVALTGNDNNIISNCNIGPAGANLPSKAIMNSGSTTTLANANSGESIDTNNIFDFFLATGSTSGMNIVGGADTWFISGNVIYQTATRTFTATARYTGITISTTAPGNGSFTIIGNTIGLNANGTGVTTITGSSNEVRGIVPSNVSTTVATSIQGNQITAFNQTTSRNVTTTGSSAFIGIALGESNGLFNVGNVDGNYIGSPNGSTTIVVNSTSVTAGTAPVIGIFDFSFQSSNISNNNIGSITIQSTGTTVGFRGILVSGTAGISTTLLNNTISNITDTQVGSYAMYGIQTATSIVTATNNTILNFSGAANGAGTVVSGGILVTNTATSPTTISRNTIHSLFNASGAASTSIYAISASLGTAANVIQRNAIHSLSQTSTSTTSQLWGILLSAGTTNVQNNMIRLGLDASGTSITAGFSIIGIRDAGVAANYYFNSVYIGGTGVVSSSNTYAFLSTTTTVTRIFENNIFWNARSNGTGTIANLAIGVGGTAPNPAGLTSNYNDLYATGVSGATGAFNAIIQTTLADWRTATGQDAISFAGDPQFLTPNGTAATGNLHINPSNPTPIESSGLAIAGVTDDFDGDVRASFTPTDVGADAGNFTSLDISPPTITYTPLANTTLTTNRSLGTTITDAGSGVPTAGAGLPVIYYRKGTSGVYASTQCTSGGGGSYSCTINYANVTGGSVTAGDTVQYYVAAQDGAATPNVTTNPSTGASGFTANPPAATTPTTAPNSYVIATAISGIKTVCPGGGCDYTTLTAAGGAFADINAKVLTTDVDLQIAGDLIVGEDGSVALNELNTEGGLWSLKIYPTGASVVESVRAITGSSATSLIRLNAADRVTIDGSNGGSGSSRLMTITNTNVATSSAVIWLQSSGVNGATSNTIKNLNIVGSNTFAGVVNGTLFGIGAGATGTPSITSTGTGNNGNTYQNNNISKSQYGIYTSGLSAAAKNTGTVITQNAINTASPSGVVTGGILVFFDNGVQVTKNNVGNILRHDGTTGLTNTAFGIALGTVPNNTTTSFTGSDVTNAVVTGNKIDSVVTLNSTGYSAFGIVVNSVTSGTTLLANNMVSGVRSAATPSDFSGGIIVGGGTGSTTQIYHNSVSMTGSRNAATNPSYALAINTGDPIVDVRDNILFNTQTSTSTGKSYAIGTGGATFVNLTSNNNDLFVSGAAGVVGQTGGLGTAGTDRLTLSAWQTTTGKDGASISADPVFVSTSDLHISLCVTSPVNNAGVFIAAVPTDYDGDTRSLTTPDIGADENAPAIPCNDSNDCTTDTCNPSTGCVYTPVGNGTNCGDAGTSCTIQDTCQSGVCQDNGFQPSGTSCGSNSDTACDNPDTCNGSGSCQANNESNGTFCGDSGTACTNQDTCLAGVCNDNGFQPSGTTCGSNADTDCDNPDTCNGSGLCQLNNETNGTFCGDSGTACTNQDTCLSGVCNDNGFQPSGTSCGSNSDTDCDNPDTCNGSGSCQINNETNGTSCGTPGVCENQDTCLGGVCNDNGFEAAGTACGSNADTDCDNPDTCNGSGLCQLNNETNGTSCGDVGTACTNQDACLSGVCNDNGFQPSGTTCGSSADTDCDNPDTCNGSGSCQINNESNGTFCGDAGTSCTNQDTCLGGVCNDNGFQPSGTACGDSSDTTCTDPDTCNGSGSCQANNASNGTSCGDAGTECINQDTCLTGLCNDNGFKASGTTCGDSSDTTCTDPDTCSGTGFCQENNASDGTFCGDAGTSCTNQDTCLSGACNDAGYQPSGTACGSNADTACDNPDTCNGTGSCQVNNETNGTFCGDAGTACTNQDTCLGGVCNDNGYQPSGTSCGSNSDTDCDNPDTCNGSGVCQTNYASSGAACSDGLGCTTGDNCDGLGDCAHTGTVDCSSGSACTSGTCVEPSGTCSYTGGTCNISGTVRYYRDHVAPAEPSTKGIPNEDVTRTSSIEPTSSSTTDTNGNYSFTNEGGDITLTPAPTRLMVDEGECHSAITAADATAISRAVVGLVTFTTNQRLAGDVSNNGTISSFDAALTAQKAVAIPCLTYAFPVRTATGSDWAFRPVSRSYTPLTGVGEDYSFLGVVYGDVTGNWIAPVLFSQGAGQAPAGETIAEASGRIPTSALESGLTARTPRQRSLEAVLYVASAPTQNQDGTWSVVLGMQGADGILGLDMSLIYDKDAIQVINVTPMGLSSAWSAAGNDSNGTYQISLFGVQALQGSGAFLKVTYGMTGNVSGLPFGVGVQANEGQIPVSWLDAPVVMHELPVQVGE